MTMNPPPLESDQSAVATTIPTGEGGVGDGNQKGLRSFRATLITLIIPIIVIVAGAGLAMRIYSTGSSAERRRPPRRATTVEVLEVHPIDSRVVIEAMGEVVAAREISLQPRVTGDVIEVSDQFLPGGLFGHGDAIMKIDPYDFELRLAQRTSEVRQTEAEVRLEQGRQLVARREYELLGEEIPEGDSDLVLRKPQLETVMARQRAAEAARDQAAIDLERTSVLAPFNAMVEARSVNVGSHVTPSTSVANLVGTDSFWVEASVPVGRLSWLEIPRTPMDPAPTARVFDEAAWGPQVHRSARAIRLTGSLEEQGRMARVLIEVADPLGLNDSSALTPRLLLRSFVRIEIDGVVLKDVFAIDREHLQESDRVLVFDEGLLEIRDVDVVYRDRDHAFIRDGLKKGDRLVITDLAAPVAGMKLRLEEPDEDSR